MKTPDSKAKSSTLQRSESPFFHRRSEQSFFGATGAQAKLSVNEPGDAHEQEADAVAEQVTAPDREPLQTKPLAPLISRKVQRQEEESTSGGGEEVSPKTERQLDESKGGGSPLPTPVREDMEGRFGTDFNDVRIHTDSRAEQMNQDVGARAFAHGSDIYFNANEYNPATHEGKKLLAHELTHTVQQAEGSLQPKRIQRTETTPAPPATDQDTSDPNKFESTSGKGSVEKQADGKFKAIIPSLSVPTIKVPFTPAPLTFNYPAQREDTQRQIWDDHMTADTGLDAKIQDKIKAMNAPTVVSADPAAPPVYAFRLKTGGAVSQRSLVIGTVAGIKSRLARPYWNPNGATTFYDVDHQREMQLGGKNELGNLWLLESSANRSSGSNINNEKETKIQGLLAEARQQKFPELPHPSEGQKMPVQFTNVQGGLPIAGRPNENYDQPRAKDAAALDGLTPLTRPQMDELGLGDASQLSIFTNATGGRSFRVRDLDPNAATVTKPLNKKAGNVKLHTVTYTRGGGGTLNATFFDGNKKIAPITRDVPLRAMQGVPMAVYITDRELKSVLGETQIKFFSPVRFDDVFIDPDQGTIGRAKVLPDLPFLANGLTLELGFEGNDIFLEASLSGNEVKLPSPFKIYGGVIAVSLRSSGTLRASGSLSFGIKNVGEGTISGSVDSNGKFSVGGEFLFDRRLFDNARVAIAYTDGQLTVSGTIQIPRGKLRGIKQATATVTYSAGTLSASGNAELDIKGLQSGAMSLRYNQEELEVGGEFQLSNEIPRIRGGSVRVNVLKRGGDYEVSAAGTASIDLPGFTDTTLSVQYQNGTLLVESTLAYEKGIAKGNVRLGATNRAVDEAGNLTGEPGDRWIIYGRGSLTLRLTPWLQATATVSVAPNGEMEVSGTIGLPGTVDVFNRKEINERLFTFPTLEIPLFAIPVGPRSIGLVATIEGGIDFNAGFGPGKLEALSATVNYKPGQEDSITLNGHGKFVIPADASLRFFGRAGVGLSVGIASVSGNLELGGAVGIKGAAEAEVDVNWAQSTGITLDATGRIYVEPALKFDLNLVLVARALFLRKEWKKNLAQKEFGSGLRYGLEFPVHYEEGKPFDLTLDNVRVIRPEISIGEAMKRFGRELI
ncbi:hypothetical protein GCM10027275_02910 [Rhabdobacter roseus]|uniref:HSP20 family molecular chaperone IbpA n=1 Tax=Rhabdobacter roseus TaxID=1655419 RepID=A0A840TR05_9BACT|nr:DUF4157 domain-containing protein [Rhabdobacter roseus]MBB5282179.1 HSP20 family molecular chaperone IbpA [Rhabdobacter roseus]